MSNIERIARTVARLFLALLLVSVPALAGSEEGRTPLPAAAAADDYCRILKQIADGATKDFADYVGEAGEDRTWQSKIALPDQERCYVRSDKRTSFICETKAFESQADAAALATETFERAAKCLGKLWDRQTQLSEFFSALNDDEHGRTVMISVGQPISPFPEYFVQTVIARTNQQPLEPEAKDAKAEAPAGYCTELKQVVASGRTAFADLISDSTLEHVGTRTHWPSRVQLPGWNDCWVHGDSGKPACRYLSCSQGPFIDLAAASKVMEQSSALAQGCLGPAWSVGRSRQTDGTLNLRLLGETKDPYVVFRPSKSLYTEAWNLTLDVDLDMESCR